MNRFDTITVALLALCLGGTQTRSFGPFVFAQEYHEDHRSDARAGGPDGKGPRGKPNGRKEDRVRPERPAEPKEPTFTVSGGFESSKDRARDSAVQAAVERLHDHLMQQDPPIARMPTADMVRKMLLRDQEKVTEEPIVSDIGQTETMYRVTVAVRVEPEHIRELRSRERSSEILWVLAGLGGLAGILAVFFRVDSWTKGYLTSWLVLGTVGAASLLAGLWWFAR